MADLEAHLVQRGYGAWASAATSEKGSYRLQDVVAFLEKHLPVQTPDTQWRILMADDHSPHRADAVRRLAWQRGWVMIVHGGGTTPVAQPVDTDLNQHVKRLYMALETAALVQMMNDGTRVPQLTRTACIDLMVQVLQDMKVHTDAAKGFIKTGIRAPLDGSKDLEICREAWHLWTEGGLGDKVDAAVADVREECRRPAPDGLAWSYNDVFRLVQPYEKNARADAVLDALAEENMGQDDDEGGVVQYADDSDLDSHASDMEGWDEAVDDVAADSDSDACESGAGHPARAAVAADGEDLSDRACVVHGVEVDAETAEQVAAAGATIAALEEAETLLREAGCVKEAQDCRYNKGRAIKRMRELSREDEGLLEALNAQRAHEQAEQAKRRRQVEQANKMTATLRSIRKQIKTAEAQKKAVMDKAQGVEAAVAAKHMVHQFTVEDLKKKKNRLAALGHLKRLKGSLSPEQVLEYDWFVNAWDDAMKKKHGKEHPRFLAGWLQNVCNEMVKGDGAAFSRFVHDESRRLLEDPANADAPQALVLPVEAEVAAAEGGAS